MPRQSRNHIGRSTNNNRRMRNARNNATSEERQEQNEANRQRMARSRSNRPRDINLNRAAFAYDHTVNYSDHNFVQIGPMNQMCQHCHAKKFKNETVGMCCLSGKVKLPALNVPPEPLFTLLSGKTAQSQHFLKKIRNYNTCFHMTSFGATKIIRDNFMPTFKIQGQVYHKIGSLIPFNDDKCQFLQIYFMGGDTAEHRISVAGERSLDRNLVRELELMLHQNALIQLFTTAIERMSSDNHIIKIQADKTPTGQHQRRYNAPTIDEVAVIIVGDRTQPRDIILHRRNNQLQSVSETHRSYDALQYPLMFPYGDDGYHFNYRMLNPSTGQETTKKVSAMSFYSYRLMVRDDDENTILKCRQLLHQYLVDMYAKIETERLNYLRFNQSKLRSEEYIHLRDAIQNDGSANIVYAKALE